MDGIGKFQNGKICKENVNRKLFIGIERKIHKNKDQQPNSIGYDYCQKFLQSLETATNTISTQTTKLIQSNATIITHSYSSTVLNTLLFAKKTGKDFSVICTESRPKNEGIQMAQQLGKSGITVKLIVDSAVFSFLSKADIILVGGDAVTGIGLINKIGTKGLAITAQQCNIPTYALCSSIKFLPHNYKINLNLQKNPNEIIKTKLLNIIPINYYFDITPFEFLTGIITDKEILEQQEIKEKIKHLKIHNSFAYK